MKTLLRRTWEVSYGLYAVISFFVLVLICLALVLLPMPVSARRRVAHVMSRLSFVVIGSRLRVHGLDHLPPGPCVVTANHSSYLDGILLQAALPPRFTFVMKKEARQIPFGGLLLHRIQSEFIERFNRRAAANDTRRLIQAAEAGQPLVFFPEGTFLKRPGIGKFHNGAFAIAARLNLPVVPLAIRGTRAMLASDQWLPRHGHIDVCVLPSVAEPATETSTTRRAEYLRDTARQRIIAAVGEPDLNPRARSTADKPIVPVLTAARSRPERSLDSTRG
jgi:1-acyl-sn-glycerol-3-phosphate acyltransferase